MTAHSSSISPLTQEAVKLIKEQLPDFVNGKNFFDLKKYLIKKECIEPLLENINRQLVESREKNQTGFLLTTRECAHQEQALNNFQEIERNLYELFLEYMQDSTKLKPGLDASELVAIGKIAALMGEYLQTQKEMAQCEPKIRQGIEAVEDEIELKFAERGKMLQSWREKKSRVDHAHREKSLDKKKQRGMLSAEKVSGDTVLIALCVAIPAVISSALMWFGVISMAAPAVFPLTVTVAVLSILTIIILSGVEFCAKPLREAVKLSISEKQVEIDALEPQIASLYNDKIIPIDQEVKKLKREKFESKNELTKLQTKLEQILDTAASIHPGNDSNHSNNAAPSSGTVGSPLYPVSPGSTAVQLRESTSRGLSAGSINRSTSLDPTDKPWDVGEEKGLNLMAVRRSSQGLFENSTALYPVITTCDDTSLTVAP